MSDGVKKKGVAKTASRETGSDFEIISRKAVMTPSRSFQLPESGLAAFRVVNSGHGQRGLDTNLHSSRGVSDRQVNLRHAADVERFRRGRVADPDQPPLAVARRSGHELAAPAKDIFTPNMGMPRECA